MNPPHAQPLLPLANHAGFLAMFFLGVAALLMLDLGVLHRGERTIRFRQALRDTLAWIALALAFNAFFWWLTRGWLATDAAAPPGAANELGLQWLASYVIELSLSVDNLFVFVVIFRHFAISAGLQHRVLFWGILGAVAFRIAFILTGIELIHRFEWLSSLLGAFLILTGARLVMERPHEKTKDLSRSTGYRVLKRLMPLTDRFHGHAFLVRQHGRWTATPLLAALVVIEMTDIIFAVDSVPAVLAITREPLVAITSNIAAILGLRAMYFLLASAVERFHLLKPALGLVLALVGAKMVWAWWHGSELLPIQWSLAAVLGIIAAGAVASLVLPPSGARGADGRN